MEKRDSTILSEPSLATLPGGVAPLEDAVNETQQAKVTFTWTVRLYVLAVALAAATAIYYASVRLSLDDWQALIALGLIAILFERIGLNIYGGTHTSAGVVPLFAIAIVCGTEEAVITAPLVVLAATLFTDSRWPQRVFDMSSYALANGAAALTFHWLIGNPSDVNGWWVPAGLVAAVVNYGVNIPLVGGAVSLSTGERWITVWREDHQWLFPYYVVFALLGLALAAAELALGIPGVLAFAAPPLMMRFALHQYVSKTEETVLELRRKNTQLETANREIMGMTQQLRETYDGTLEALVLALDARDRETKGHSLRVMSYVMMIARKLSVPEDTQEWTDIQRGALLHDVGKIGVPDYILHKPGPLTPEEWDNMKRHPHIGLDMLKDISFLSGAAEIVFSHHERFDGRGYPRGLAGDEIALGARIFTVADTFDSMTSDRPYRKGLSPQASREEIMTHSGTQFDPQVVQAFLLVYDQFEAMALAKDKDKEPEKDRQAA